MIRQGLWALAIPIASTGLAEDLSLQLPVNCVLGENCYIQQYMDRDPGPGYQDFHCQALSYDGHKGTDFAVPTLADMEVGVPVLAAADGRVRGFRDRMPDTGYSPQTAAQIEGNECGNGLVLVHPGGWETQYCHLKRGSLTIRNDQAVKAGDVLGLIGMSGRTEFPHLHFSVRKGGKPVDPFDPDGVLDCDQPGDSTLWADPVAYQPGGVISAGLTITLPEASHVRAGLPPVAAFTPDAPALIVYGLAFGARQDDVLRLSIEGPFGAFVNEEHTFERNRSLAFRSLGAKRPRDRDWPMGTYKAEVTLERDGKVLSTMFEEVAVATD